MPEEIAANATTVAQESAPAVESAPQTTANPVSTESGTVAKEVQTNVDERLDKHPRFKEVIYQKNEAQRKAQELERRLAELESRNTPKDPDPFDGLAPEEREQTEKFINKFVAPKVKKEMMAEIAPFIQEVQNDRLNKQVSEAKTLASKVGIDFDERLPEIVDFLSRPENKGRLTAKEALVSLYADEFIEAASNRGKEEVSREQRELLEKKKLANTAINTVSPNVSIQSDKAALAGMDSRQRMAYNIQRAIDLAKQGVSNPKVKN